MMTNPEWYWAQDGEQHGPIAEAELRERFLSGELPEDILVWSEGMQGWAQAGKVPDLTREPPPPPPVAPQAPTVAAAGATGGMHGVPAAPTGQIDRAEAGRQAWSRFAARSIDMALASALVMAVSGVPSPDDSIAMLVTWLIGAALWILIEPVFLSRSGMTPGKWLFRVRVVHPEGRLLSYAEGLKRAVQATVVGLGAGLPILSIVMPALAFREYTATGTTPWDRSGGFLVQYGVMRGAQKAVLAIVLLILLLSLLSQPAG